MSEPLNLDSLDDPSILLILSYLSEDMRQELPSEIQEQVHSETEARQLVRRIAAEFSGAESPDETRLVAVEDLSPADGREILRLLSQDKQLRPKIDVLVANPPRDEQMSVELAIAGAILLGVVVTWLQTRLDIDYSNKDGKKEFSFKLHKNTARPDLIKGIAKSVVEILTKLA